MRKYSQWITVLALIVCGWSVAPSAALAQDAAAACKAMGSGYGASPNATKFAEIPEAPTSIVSVRLVDADPTHDMPQYCRVEGEIAPTIGFLLRMPSSNWNGKLLMGGCGGPCGTYLEDRTDPALARHYAVVSTDMGHKGIGWLFAYENLQQEIDFGSRATHLTAVAAKVIADTFYSQEPKHAYFNGCSTGGRQAMVEAERFPDDFDGIIAGAPPYYETGDTPLFLSWGARANMMPDGKTILGAEKLPMIHEAVMNACQSKGALNGSVLLDPQSCHWQPKEIECKAGKDGANCLSPAQVEVVQKIYDGATNSKAYKLYFGMARGSELQWVPGFLNTDGKPGIYLAGFGGPGNSIMNYAAYFYSQGPNYDSMKFNYDTDLPKMAVIESIYNAQNPDLRAFDEAGGKLILYHGWNDDEIPPMASVDYYQTSMRVSGGEENTKKFFRLFMLPGVGHCRGGAGGGEVDWITALEGWVEHGNAPDSVIANRMATEPYPTDVVNGQTVMRFPHYPLAPGTYVTSRPVYAYPGIAKWNGTGDAKDASSWEKAPQ
jgi:pimeloyl-ACP methyl ester carboxylesterase